MWKCHRWDLSSNVHRMCIHSGTLSRGKVDELLARASYHTDEDLTQVHLKKKQNDMQLSIWRNLISQLSDFQWKTNDNLSGRITSDCALAVIMWLLALGVEVKCEMHDCQKTAINMIVKSSHLKGFKKKSTSAYALLVRPNKANTFVHGYHTTQGIYLWRACVQWRPKPRG